MNKKLKNSTKNIKYQIYHANIDLDDDNEKISNQRKK